MAIKTIRVKNFKSFRDVEVHLGDFNVLIGANASGKSNFIRIIEFLRDIQRYDLGNAISLQGGSEYLTNLNIGSGEGLYAEVLLSGFDSLDMGLVGTSDDGSTLHLTPHDARHGFSIAFLNAPPGFEIREERLTLNGQFVSTGFGRPARTFGVGAVHFERRGGVTTACLEPPEGVSFAEYQMRGLASERVTGQSFMLDQLLFNVERIIKDTATYDFDPKLPKKATPVTGKADLEEDGSNLAIVLKRIIQSEEGRRKLANLLRDLLPFVTDLDVENFADKSLLFSLTETYAKDKHLPASLVSDGTINITALIVALYFEKKAIAIIEEPERNVHPHLISRITAMMKDASRQKQIIVTTHNPEVIKSTDVSDVLLVSRDAEGFSTISRPAEKEEVKVFLQNEMGLEELFAQNLLHA